MQLQVPGLGAVSGLTQTKYAKVEQYNGIPYGSISARFRQSKLVTSWPDNKWDGTKYGPICPFPRMVIGHALTQKSLPPQHDYNMDEFKCLNLNVTCPKHSKPGDNLPVIVWIHGGNNVVGSGSDPGYNAAPLVNFSVEKGMPTIVVTINYRLGAFGFLASQELKDDNQQAGDQGCGNYGIRDQFVAYEWVKKNIEAFGGDSSRITAMGHSAGSIDTHIAIISSQFAKQQPFHQAILQSGVGSLTIRTIPHQQSIFDKISAHAKIDSTLPPAERLSILRKLSSDDLVAAYIARGAPVSSWQATVDGYFLTSNTTASQLPKLSYPLSLKRLLIGDCAAEGLIFAPGVKAQQLTYARVSALALEHLKFPLVVEEVLRPYGITADQAPDLLFRSVIRLVTDAEWCQPVNAVAKSFPRETYYYHITAKNPFEGSLKGTAHHGVDLLFCFMTYQEHLGAGMRASAEELAGKWLSFVNGKEPWGVFEARTDGQGVVMAFGEEGKVGEMKEEGKESFDRLKLCEGLQDRIGGFAAALRGEVIED